jgi:uncharacterized protein DUF6544
MPTLTGQPSALGRLIAYCFPGGADAARGVRGIRTKQRGEIRSSGDARWNPFTAEEFVDATRSAFCWDARLGTGLMSVTVTDAYEDGSGRLVVRKGPIQLQRLTGLDVDKGELQRYLAYAPYYPPMMLNNPALELTDAGPLALHVRDHTAPAGTSVDVEIDERGQPVVVRAIRPMTIGKRVVLTPWSARATKAEEHEGMRIYRLMEAAWDQLEGSFTYIRIELTSIAIERS